MKGTVEGINPEILVECREQLGLTLEQVSKELPKISAFETGKKKPTFNQLDKLAKLYSVPRWVFISRELPEEFRFENSMPAFRQFKETSQEFLNDSKLKLLITRVEQKRNLLIDLLEEMDESPQDFDIPNINISTSASRAASIVRSWLGADTNNFPFSEWKKLVEGKGVFVFLTSKYNGWSHVQPTQFRGLSIYHKKIPIIIINNSDSKKAQSFTLFHELGHLLRRESSIDFLEYSNVPEEKWCDDFSGNVLMPETQLLTMKFPPKDLDQIKQFSKDFLVSPFALTVRLRRLNLISQETYNLYSKKLNDEFIKIKEDLKKKPGGPPRDLAKETLIQFGGIYVRTLFQAYYNDDITLKKLTHFLGLKRASYIPEIESII